MRRRPCSRLGPGAPFIAVEPALVGTTAAMPDSKCAICNLQKGPQSCVFVETTIPSSFPIRTSAPVSSIGDVPPRRTALTSLDYSGERQLPQSRSHDGYECDFVGSKRNLVARRRSSRLHFVGLAIDRACDHFGRLGIARELRGRTGLDLQRAADAVADVRQMAEIGAGHRVGDRIVKILLPA